MKRIKNKKKELLKIYIFFILVIPIILILFWKNLDLFLKFNELRKQDKQLYQKINIAEANIEETKKNIQKLETPFGQDEIIFEKFSRKKPGEKVIEILE